MPTDRLLVISGDGYVVNADIASQAALDRAVADSRWAACALSVTSEEVYAGDRAPAPAKLAIIDRANPVLPGSLKVTVVAKLDLFRRTTDEESDAIDAAMMNAPSRLRNIFQSAITLRSDSDEWRDLLAIARSITGPDGQRMLSEERIAVLLAPSV